MKVGDLFPVTLQGMAVAEAQIENIEDGQATLVIPATRVVIRIRQSLDVEATNTPEVDRTFGGLEELQDNTPAPAVAEHNSGIEEQPEPVRRSTPINAIGEGIHNVALDSSAID